MINLQIKWGKEIADKIKKLGEIELKKARKKWLTRASILVQWEAKKQAPVDKGLLRKYINYEVKRNFARVYDNVAYAYRVHEWTKPHDIEIKPKNKKALFRKWAKHPIKKVSFRHPWYKGNPFFTRAVEKTRSKVKERYEEILQSITSKWL